MWSSAWLPQGQLGCCMANNQPTISVTTCSDEQVSMLCTAFWCYLEIQARQLLLPRLLMPLGKIENSQSTIILASSLLDGS